MQRNEVVALVAGASIGMGGGTLGAFVVWAIGSAAARRLLDQFGCLDGELIQPVPPGAQRGIEQARLVSAPVTQPPNYRSLPTSTKAVTSVHAHREP